jgi:DNA-binding response OmpR family regulator
MAALSRILIVDDDQELRAFVTLTFELVGYQLAQRVDIWL